MDDEVGILGGNFKEGAVVGEVDASNFNLCTANVAVHEVDDFSSIEVVALAEVDEETSVSFFCLMVSGVAFASVTAGLVAVGR